MSSASLGLDMSAFEQAWMVLKANPFMMMGGKTIHPSVANYMMMGNRIIDETEYPRDDGRVMSREQLQEMARRAVSNRMKATPFNIPTPFGPLSTEYGEKNRFMFPSEERDANLRSYNMFHYDPELYEGQLEQR